MIEIHHPDLYISNYGASMKLNSSVTSIRFTGLTFKSPDMTRSAGVVVFNKRLRSPSELMANQITET